MYKSQLKRPYSNTGKYERKLHELEAKRNSLVRSGKLMESFRLNEDIKKITKLIEEEKKYQPQPLKTLVDEQKAKEAVALIVECHLAADYLTATAYALKDWFKAQKLVAISVIPEIEEIIKKSEAFASALCKVNGSLSDLMTDNETLMNALHKKTLSYIGQRLK